MPNSAGDLSSRSGPTRYNHGDMRACSSFLLALLVALSGAPARAADPLAEIYAGEVRSSVESLIDQYRRERRFSTVDFPMSPQAFDVFRRATVDGLVAALGMEQWVVREPQGKRSPIAGLYRDRLLRRFVHDGVSMEAHVIEIVPTGDQVPAVLCLPEGSGPRPGVACYPGHGPNGLRDLVLDESSYQRAIATQLAKAGFVSIAIEKIDSGYLAREAPSGVDEKEITSFRLGLGSYTRAVQLMATVAAAEILASHPRTDESQIGATGVSLGGWLAIQTALLSDRIRAVAEYGTKTVFLGEETKPEDFGGVTDMCHVIPGTFALGDRNILMLAYAPRPLLSGHGGPERPFVAWAVCAVLPRCSQRTVRRTGQVRRVPLPHTRERACHARADGHRLLPRNAWRVTGSTEACAPRSAARRTPALSSCSRTTGSARR